MDAKYQTRSVEPLRSVGVIQPEPDQPPGVATSVELQYTQPRVAKAADQAVNSAVKWWAKNSDNASDNALDAGIDASVNQTLVVDSLIDRLNSGPLWVVNSRRRNGIILYRGFYAEFAGPGAAVGGALDADCEKIIPLGNLSLLEPASHEDQQKALKIRLQWIRLTQNFTDQPRSEDRAQMILEQFKTYFDQSTVDQVPNEAFALLVGVLPQTIQRVRSGFA